MKKPIPFGKYYLLDRISVGGMAEVFKAKAFGVEGFERLIAVKRILPSIAEDEEFITMFIDEAKIAVQLQHANIAQIFDLGKVGDSYFIALEYVSGRDARSIFERLRKTGQAVPIPMAAYITMKVCEGLDYAHNKKDAAGRDLNLVHRDVSPQNLLISYDGEVKLIDFGIAKAAGKAGKTQAGILKGKFGYMSPEQVRGLPLDRRSDIFAVGICMWEMITGERLFVGESDFSTLEKVRNVDITPPSHYNRRIPPDLERTVLKALSKEVEDRYQSAMDLHDDLQSWMYTSGNFFARKDLAGFMHEVFRDEIEKESMSNDVSGELARSTVPPPPKVASRPSTRGHVRPGAPPPPPRGSVAPPPRGAPSPRVSAPPPRTSAPAPQQHYGAPVGRSVPPAAPQKRTMMGMPAVSAPPASPGVPTAGRDIPADLASGHVATPVQPPAQAAPALQMDEWDDDEPPTSVYSKENAAEIAKAALAQKAANIVDPALSSPQKPAEAAAENDSPFRSSYPEPISEDKPLNLMPLFLAGGAVLVIVAVVVTMILVFGGKKSATVQLAVDPQEDLEVIVDGTRALPGNVSPFTISELAAGPHSILIRKSGYEDKQLSFDIRGDEGVINSKVTLDRPQTGFFLETDPPGALIWIDERPHEDKTPVTVSGLKPGPHKIRISKGDKYAAKIIEVNLVEGELQRLPTKVLELKEVEITINSKPEGAKATLLSGSGEQKLGKTPVQAVIDAALEYRLRLEKDGYESIEKPLKIEPGKEKVSLEAFALKAVEEQQERSKPVARARTSAPPKREARPARAAEEDNTGGGGGGFGLLSVQTRPWSKVFINGKFIKNTPLVNHKLRAGTYNVTVENPTYNIKKSYSATVKPNKTTTLVKTLI